MQNLQITQVESQLAQILALRNIILHEHFTLQINTPTGIYNLGDLLPYNVDTSVIVLLDNSIDKLQKELIFLNSII